MAEVSAAAVVAVLASASEDEDRNAPPWRPDNEYTSEVFIDVISLASALSGPSKDGQRFAHVQSIIHTDIGREEFGRGMTTFWRRLVDEPDAFPPEFWQLFLQSSLTTLGEKCRLVCVGMTWRRLITAGLCGSGGRGWRRSAERVEAVWGRRTRRSGARRTESTTATRDGQLARCY